MDLLGNLETYIAAQKGVGFNAFVFSVSMIIVAILFHFYGTSPLSTGLRNGTFVIGIILIGMGIGLRVSQENILKGKRVLYQLDKEEFRQVEMERMTKVKNNYPRGQMIMSSLVVISLLVFLLIKSQVWQGVSLSLAIFFLGNIIIEAFSYLAIFTYYSQLTN